jgi:hypothetical protein
MVESKMQMTNRNLFWLRYDYNLPLTLSSRVAVSNPLDPVENGSDATNLVPEREDLHLHLVLETTVMTYLQAKGTLMYQDALEKFFHVSRGFVRNEEHFELRGIDVWVRYARYLALYAMFVRTEDLKNASKLPVPTLGMQLTLHLHRTAPLKYARCMEMLSISPLIDIAWEQSETAIKETKSRWDSIFNDPYQGESQGTDTLMDTEYNSSVKAKKQSTSSADVTPKSSLAGSSRQASSSSVRRSGAAKKVTIMTMEPKDDQFQ